MRKTSLTSKVLVNEQEQKRMKRIGSPLVLILLLVAVVSTALAAYFYQQANALKQNPQSQAQKEAQELVSRVSQLIVLPEGEVPTIATVQDPEVLKEQPFFARAKKGDKVLIYTNARKAILYDPDNNKIVEVAPVNIGNPQAVPAEEVSSPVSEEETPQP